jgi:hypothetical protein
MTLNEAFHELINSPGFKETAKTNSKYRSYVTRFNNAELKYGAIVELLLENGYEVKANKARKTR